MFSILIFFLNVIYSFDGKAEFSSAFSPVFSDAWEFRNNSIMLMC